MATIKLADGRRHKMEFIACSTDNYRAGRTQPR